MLVLLLINTLREEQRFGLFEYRVLRGMFRPKRDKKKETAKI
jgi:hypothetical protein